MVDIEIALQERLKELKCLFGMSELVNTYEDDLDEILKGLLILLPRSWRFPDITLVSIELDGRIYRSPGYRETRWKLEAPVRLGNSVVGTVKICYQEEQEFGGGGAFLEEERMLLNAVTERLGRIAERIRTKKQLQIEEQALRNKNIALREVMEQMREENRETARRVQANVDNIVIPIIESLEAELKYTSSEAGLRLLHRNLSEITAPLYSNLTREFNSLTPKELRICTMIARGASSKEIAGLEHISPVTVHHHRENIRRKLGLKNTKTNLTRYLQTYIHASDDLHIGSQFPSL